jgi:ATP-dependent Clp protease ATP-binding subunit ClpA
MPTMSSGPEASKVFGRFTEQAHQVLDLGRDEAEQIGHRYLGPEHLLLGMLRERASGAARLLRTHGIALAAARGQLLVLAERGVVPAARPSDRELLGTLGVDLEEIRRATKRTFGATALGEATWRVTRRRGWRGGGVVWTPLCGPPFLAKRALQLASQQASVLGHDVIGPELVLLGVVEDARQPADSPRGSRRHKRIIAHVGLPDGYQGAAGPLLAALEVDLEALRRAVLAALGGGGS